MKPIEQHRPGTGRQERGLQAAARWIPEARHELMRRRGGRLCGLKAALLFALGVCASLPAGAQTIATNKLAEPKKTVEAVSVEELPNWITVGIGGVSTSGDRAQFQERWNRAQGALGGLQDFHLEMPIGKWGMLELDGNAMYGGHDYSMRLGVSDPDRGYLRAGFREFKTWYDGSGGYYPGTGASFSFYDENLGVNRGEFWIEAGLTPPDGPRLTLRLTREYRRGTKDSIIWGDSTQAGAARGMVPSFRELDEVRNRLEADLKHTLGKSDFGLGLRLELVENNNTFKERRFPGVAADRYVTQRDIFESDMVNAHAFTETRFNDRILLTSGYSYTRFSTDVGGSRIYGNSFDASPNLPANDGSGFTGLSGGAIADQYVMNLALRLDLAENFVIAPSLRAEKIDTVGDSQFNETPANTFTRISQQDGFVNVTEALEARFTGFTNWVLYTRGEWMESDGYLQESGTPGPLFRTTDSERFTQKYTVGANWYPLRKLHLSGQYYHKSRQTEYFHLTDSTANTSGNRYPAYLREHSFQTDDMNVRATWRPRPNVTLVTRYDFQISSIETVGDTLGGVESAQTTAHIISQSLTWVPWSRLFLQGSISYALDATTTPTSAPIGAVSDARNDYWQASTAATFVVDDKTDLQANYFYYRANNFINNSTVSMPYGASANDHAVNASLIRNFSQKVRGTLSYGFFAHRDETSGGRDNYDAHLIFSTITYRF